MLGVAQANLWPEQVVAPAKHVIAIGVQIHHVAERPGVMNAHSHNTAHGMRKVSDEGGATKRRRGFLSTASES